MQLTQENKIFLLINRYKYSQTYLSHEIGVSKNAVSKFYKRYDQNQTLARKSGSGRKRKTTSAQDRRLLASANADRFATCAEIAKIVSQMRGPPISPRTVNRRLLQAGLKCCKPVCRPLLTNKMMEKRLLFARKYVNWPLESWNSVIWSDESKFNLYYNDGRVRVRRFAHEKFDRSCIKQMPKSRAGVMVWGCFAGADLGKLQFLENTVNADEYISILETSLFPSIENIMAPNEDFIFQHDHAPAHTAKKVPKKDCFQDKVINCFFFLILG
jgi:transposase